ncbi:MAG TPA: MBL fold metallo-hydrolase, partial [Solirubrobacteraceae bacterium]
DGHTVDGMAIWVPWTRVLIAGDYLSPVEIPIVVDAGAYRATLERLRPLVEAADWVVPGHGEVLDGTRALAILREDVRYLEDGTLPLARRTAR